MPMTRTRATSLLNKTEMGLYDDSRANPLRRMDSTTLRGRVERARKARDRARDLVQRHKLASRRRSGSKRGPTDTDNQRSRDKAELLADILKRFEAQLKLAGRNEAAVDKAARATKKSAAAKKKTAAKQPAARKAAAKKGPARKATGKKAATKKVAARKATAKTASTKKATAKKGKATSAAAKKAAPKKATAKKTTAKKTTAKKTTAKKTPGKRAGTSGSRRRQGITPEQALENTRALLEAKQEQARRPKPWEAVGGDAAGTPSAGFQSDGAAHRAEELHAAETRLPAIQGSIGTRDRINQGKRDHRGDAGE
ncbi:histone H1-like repetitive region-containing protein [Luteimonas salinisoli]|nr:histone H1-like repetitive region-containing protein [Luteimonas salinisoli]